VAGEVSGGRLGRAESAGIERAADEDPAGTDAVAVSSGHRQESPAVPFRVCAVDPGNDPDSAAGAISTEIEPGECGAATEATGANVSASVVPGDGARSETGAAVAGARVSGDSGTGPEDRGRDLLWRRSGGAIGLPRGDYVGNQGPDAGGAQHGAAQFGEHDLGGDRARWAALHGDERQNQRVGLYGVPEAAALFHAFQNEIHSVPLRALHAAQGGTHIILLAHFRLRPFDCDPVVPRERLYPPLILVRPSRENFLADHRLAHHLLEEMNHLPGPGQPAQITIDDHPVETVIYKQQQAAKQLCERLHRSSPLFSSSQQDHRTDDRWFQNFKYVWLEFRRKNS